MSMEKYGVEDRAEQQRKELRQVRSRMANTTEKTASAEAELATLKAREVELMAELDKQ